VWGLAMNAVSASELRMIGAKVKSNGQDDAELGSEPISLLSYLEMENVRLRQAVVELSLDTMALREELIKAAGYDRVANIRPRQRRLPRPARVSIPVRRVRVTKTDLS
jgi:hypothetical protein